MNRFKKEKFIVQRQFKSGWSFQVIIRKNGHTVIESFSESDYGSAKLAYDSAIRYRDKKLNEIIERKLFPTKHITLDDVFCEMQEGSVDSSETKRKELLNYNKRIPNHEILFNDITPFVIQESLNQCVNDSDDTIQRVMALWRKIFNYAILRGYASVDHTRMVKLPKSRKIIKKRPVLYDGDLDLNLLNRIKNVRERNLLKYAIQIMMYTGARPCEVFALSKADIFDDHISINKELGDNRDKSILRPCKTPESVRVIPVSSKLKQPLHELINASQGDYLFVLDTGNFMNSKWAGERLNRYMKGFNLYMLRHRASTIWDKNNVSLRTIDELMGHKSSSMSTDYARSDWSSKVKAIEML